MTYTKFFDPPQEWRVGEIKPEESIDRRDGSVYYFHHDDIVLAVNVALVTGRPLFLQGPSGSGKSSLARTIARNMRRRYYERVISSRTTVRDLLWQFDALRRLQDAQVKKSEESASTLNVVDYIEPGVLWWAFDPLSAAKLPRAVDRTITDFEPKPHSPEELATIPAVVLLDEIDKADPDLPNDLLVPLGSQSFTVEGITDDIVARGGERDPKDIRTPLIIVTTNNERDMPPAFLRRCVILNLPAPNRDALMKIARLHLGDARMAKVKPMTDKLLPEGATPAISTAEMLDALHAAAQLDADLDTWEQIATVTIRKTQETRK
jgi:MoxR-like ATPase